MCKNTFCLLALVALLIIGSVTLSAQNVSLHVAALQGNLEEVKKHVEGGSNLNEKDRFGSTPLIIAITFGKTEVAKVLIDAGADLKLGDTYGSTPLHLAAFFGRKELVKYLLKKGADKYVRNINGSTPFDIAASSFELDKEKYDQLNAAIGQLGFKLDYDKIRRTRPELAEMLKPRTEELIKVNYTPLVRDDWKTSTPEKQGLDSMLVAELYNDAAHLKTLYGLLILKNGYLIAEKYFNNAFVDQLSSRASVTKSVTSSLLGIAIEQGFIENTDQNMIDYFPEVADKIADERKESITIKEMLQMRAGYPWEETDTTYWNALWTGKYIDKIIDLPLTINPGTGFQYSNFTSNWLGIIIARSTNSDLKSFGEKNLFSKLNVEIGEWKKDWNGYYIGCADLEITTRDMAKFGYLYLNNGNYNGEQLIPANWVDESLQIYSTDINSAGIESSKVGRYFHDIGYGYQWWFAKVGNHSFNLAWGHGGQFIILLHDLDMIIVTTADPFNGKEKHFDAWQYEKSIINLLGKFIDSIQVN